MPNIADTPAPMSPGPAKRRRWLAYAGGTGALALLAWGMFHPELRPDVKLTDTAVLAELARTGFASTRNVSLVRYKTHDVTDGQPGELIGQQSLRAVDPVLTEKRTRRTERSYVEESVGLFAGPFMVLRLTRNRPPLVGGLLPYQFWNTSRMTEFRIDQIRQFPHAVGGTLRARVTYEDKFPDGKLSQTERIILNCEIGAITEATSIDPALSGTAARVDCRETLAPEGRIIGEANRQPRYYEKIAFSHWYIHDLGWSFPIQGEQSIRINDETIARTWKTTLISFQ